ncbi:hypothetical protein EC960939_1861, partial [Escherichia coli 96.0939]
MHVVTCR